MEFIVFYLFFALGVGWVAGEKTLGFMGGFLLSLILTPIIGFIITLFYPSKSSVENRIKMARTETSVADELKKISNLRDTGAITEEEFQEFKGRLLKV